MVKFFNWLTYSSILMVYVMGANLDVMEVDAAQYASISLEMLKSGEFLQVLDRGQDYLDKPPLLFWLSAVSFKFFGVGSWQYKLPSILFSLLAIFSTFKLGKRLYNAKIGHHAAMILGGSLAMIMISNDIKTDTILVSSIVFSIWMLVSYLESHHLKYILGAAIGISIAILTKGPIGLMMPALAIGGHLVLKKQWKPLLDWRWLLLIIGVGALLLPMCLGLYQQYGAEGLKFFFWTQSFGRITGESSWQNNTTPLYFFHVFLWSFLPWTLIAIGALFNEFKSVRKNLAKSNSEFYLISGISLVWLALSFSKFKLPHYIFVVYPLIAILSAKYINNLISFSKWAWTQLTIALMAGFFLIFALIYCFADGGVLVPIIIFLAAVGATIVFFMFYRSTQVIYPTFIMSIAIGIGMNLHFYPQLLPFQANAQVGRWVEENDIPEGKFIDFSTGGRALDFYAGGYIPWMQTAEETIEAIEPGTVVYANRNRYNDLLSYGAIPKREIEFKNFEVQNLKISFLNPKTRSESLKKHYLLFY
mgnify:CR=1 FL=1